MGRLSLQALQVRRRALANAADRFRAAPLWLDAVAEIPPAQILTRQQPTQHPLLKTRTQTLPQPASSSTRDNRIPASSKTIQTTTASSRPNTRPSRKFRPLPIHYEEDSLRSTFYTHHPWELARPRVVLESSGNDSLHTDYSRGVRSPNAHLSGESVVQRQLYLLQNVPDISEKAAYDQARKEFYDERLKEDLEMRVAAEEARSVGAEFGKGLNERSEAVEDRMYDDWEKWSRSKVTEMNQKAAAFVGQAIPEGANGQGDEEEESNGNGVFGNR